MERTGRLVSELLFTRIVYRYIIYIRDTISQTDYLTKLTKDTDKKFDLSNYPKIKRFYQEELNTPLYLTADDENLAGQIITIRNLIVHNFNYIPDEYINKFHNWKELERIKQDDDVFYIELDFSSLDKLGNFLSRSAADIDDRISKKYNIEQYYFDEEEIPEEKQTPYHTADEDFFDEDT